jgi:hypothetical protein
MIRKMLVAGAAAVLPVTGLAGAALVATSGVAGAGSPVVQAISCNVSGTVAFGGGGIKSTGNVNSDSKTTSVVTLNSATGSDAGCSGSATVSNIIQKTTKCKSVVTLGSASFAGLTLTPGATYLPNCDPASKLKENNSAWGFLGGVSVGGVASSTTDGIATALKKGVAYTDNGVALTLLVNQAPGAGVTAVTPGGACGTGVGFEVNGTVKKATNTWKLDLCLSSDTGAGTTGSFLSDLATEVIAGTTGGTPFQDGVNIATATVDPTASQLTIS